MLALIVSVHVRPEKLATFQAAIATNALHTFRDEPGCTYFDVAQDRADPLHYMFYELYENEAALDAHRAAPHFRVWREAAAECLVPGSQVNTICELKNHHA